MHKILIWAQKPLSWDSSDLWSPLSLLTSAVIFPVTAYFYYDFFTLHLRSEVGFFKGDFKPSFVVCVLKKMAKEGTEPWKGKWLCNLFPRSPGDLLCPPPGFQSWNDFCEFFYSNFYSVFKIFKNSRKVTSRNRHECVWGAVLNESYSNNTGWVDKKIK